MLEVLVRRDHPVKEPGCESQRGDSSKKPGVSEFSLLHVKPCCTLGDELWTLADLVRPHPKDGMESWLLVTVDRLVARGEVLVFKQLAAISTKAFDVLVVCLAQLPLQAPIHRPVPREGALLVVHPGTGPRHCATDPCAGNTRGTSRGRARTLAGAIPPVQPLSHVAVVVTRVVAIAEENSTLGFPRLLLCWDRHLSSMLAIFVCFSEVRSGSSKLRHRLFACAIHPFTEVQTADPVNR